MPRHEKSKIRLPDPIDISYAIYQPPKHATNHEPISTNHATIKADKDGYLLTCQWHPSQDSIQEAFKWTTEPTPFIQTTSLSLQFFKQEPWPPLAAIQLESSIPLTRFNQFSIYPVDESSVPTRYRQLVAPCPPGKNHESIICQIESHVPNPGRYLTVALKDHAKDFHGTEHEATELAGYAQRVHPNFPTLGRGARHVLLAPLIENTTGKARYNNVDGDYSDLEDATRDLSDDFVRQLWRLIQVRVPHHYGNVTSSYPFDSEDVYTSPTQTQLQDTHYVNMFQSLYNGSWLSIVRLNDCTQPRLIVQHITGDVWTGKWKISNPDQVTEARQICGRMMERRKNGRAKGNRPRQRKEYFSSSEEEEESDKDAFKTRTIVPTKVQSRPSRAAKQRAEVKVSQINKVFEEAGVHIKKYVVDDDRFKPVENPSTLDQQRSFHFQVCFSTHIHHVNSKIQSRLNNTMNIQGALEGAMGAFDDEPIMWNE